MSDTEITYICGPSGIGKTILAEALRDYFLRPMKTGTPRRVAIIGEYYRTDSNKIISSALSGDWDIIIVDWAADFPEEFPVKPYRVIRINKE